MSDYYTSPEYKQKLQAAEKVEKARQELCASIRTKGSIAYARFLLAVENDASLNHGQFGSFSNPSDEQLYRVYPSLKNS